MLRRSIDRINNIEVLINTQCHIFPIEKKSFNCGCTFKLMHPCFLQIILADSDYHDILTNDEKNHEH